MSRRKLVAANWKMHGDLGTCTDLAKAFATAADSATAEVLICPPACYLTAVGAALRDSAAALGGQNLCEHAEAGAHTGEINGAMLVDCGASYVIVGHSERRADRGESDGVVAAKFLAAQAARLTPVLCVGETLEQRDAGDTGAVLDRQLRAVIDAAGIDAFAQAVIAYEPVWAIGTGRSATPVQAQEAHAHLRATLAAADARIAGDVRILYGGSVKAANAAELFAQSDVDGGLVGGASLKADEFTAIIAAA